MKNKKGISLIVLVITIIVMIILAASIILSLNNAGIIGNANQAVFKQNIKNYLSELDLYYMDELIANSGTNTKNISATATTSPSITDLIPSMSEEDATKFRVAGGKLIYIGANRSEYEWCRELGLPIDSTNLTEAEYNALYAEEIAYAESIGGVSSEMIGGYIVDTEEELKMDIIVLPYGTTTIGFGAFDSLPVKEVVVPNTVTYIDDWSFLGCTELTTVILPDSVTGIGEAFLGCTALETLELSSNLTRINGSFNGCTALESITIPESVTYINTGTSPFGSCTNLKSIYVEEGNTKYTSIDGALYNIDTTILMSVPAGKTGNFVIPSTVTTIDIHCFESCSKITNIIIPSSVTTIKSAAFQGCKSLTSLVIPDTVTSFNTSASFGGCTNLVSIKLPNSITSIGSGMFNSCKSLKSIEIPENVTTIGNGAFLGCSSLTEITLPSKVTKLEGVVFRGCNSLMKIYIESTSALTFTGSKDFDELPVGSVIYVKNATVESSLDGKYDTSTTTISTNW